MSEHRKPWAVGDSVNVSGPYQVPEMFGGRDVYCVIRTKAAPEPCSETYYGDECDKTDTHVWHSVNYPNGTSVQWEGESLPRADYACAICGEPEGSDYARPCCENNVEMI